MLTVSATETTPEERPTISIKGNASRDDLSAAWERIEAYTAYRWGVRTVTFIVEGPGLWSPPIEPFTASTDERWENDAWAAWTPENTPYGIELSALGPYRISGNVGAATADQTVKEAIHRLAEYFAVVREAPGSAALRSVQIDTERSRYEVGTGLLRVSAREFNANWTARAIQLSGAADLLRGYRKQRWRQ